MQSVAFMLVCQFLSQKGTFRPALPEPQPALRPGPTGFLLALLVAGLPSFGQTGVGQGPDSIRAITQKDHQKMMEQMHISALRPGANGTDPDAPNAANYDEAKANPYPELPDPLLLKNGSGVLNPKTWWSIRRPEILEDFDREIYGRTPERMPEVVWEVAETLQGIEEKIPVIKKILIGHVDNSIYPSIHVDIQLTVVIPADTEEPVPLVLAFGYNRPSGSLASSVPAVAPDNQSSWQQQVLSRGWAFAILIPGSIQQDNGAGLTQGIIGLMNRGKTRKPDDWGALKAWAWGASNALDYLQTDKLVDAEKVAIFGHSRYGKAALVTMAYDSRFAIGFISSSGEGGAKLHRRNAGEIVENVASPGEYHWMAGNFMKYAGPLHWNDLPVDSHELIALCAPRPVFISCGEKGDGWTDPRGMFMAAVAAGPVYKLLGKRDLGTSEFPKAGTSLTDSEIAFRQHSGGHTPGPNWPSFLEYANKYFAE